MTEKIANIVMRYGVTKEEYKKCLPEIKRSNRIMLATFCWAMSVFFLVLLLIEDFTAYTFVRVIALIGSILLGVLIWKKGNDSLAFMRAAIFIALALIYITTGYQGVVLNPVMYSTTFLLALAAFPVFLVDCPLCLVVLSGVACACYLCFAWHMKAAPVRLGDTYNVILAFMWGLIAHYGLGAIRMQGMIGRAELTEKYDSQLAYRNDIAKNSLFFMRVDLDDDHIFEYTYTEPQLGSLVTAGIKASELMNEFAGNAIEEEWKGCARRCLDISSLQSIFDQGENYARAKYKCKVLQIYVELNVSLIKNPTTGHIEAFFVFKDVNDSSMTQKAFGAIINSSYDFVGIADTLTGGFSGLSNSEGDAILTTYFEDYDTATRQLTENMKDHFLTEDDYLTMRENVSFEKVVAHLKETPLYEFNVRIKGSEQDALIYRFSFCYIDAEKTQILVCQTNVTQTVSDEEQNRQMLASALRAAEQASRAKSEFLSRMSHEIRTPMNAIIGISALAMEDVNQPEIVGEDLTKIHTSAKYLLNLINDILDMSRIESGRMTLNNAPIDFTDFIGGINNIISTQCISKGITYEVTGNGNMRAAYVGDRLKLQQILVNILGNSVKFTPKGGKITLRMEQIGVEAGQAILRFTMKDTGIGIDQAFIPHLFNAFEQESTGNTTSYGGTGLGLAITKNMVEMMDGQIEVNSEKGVGSEFIVEVKLGISEEPIQNELDENERKMKPEKTEYHLEGKHILLVEDHPMNTEIATRILKSKGMLVTSAANGQEAIECFGDSEVGTYDAILMDVRMPVMDGLSAASHIRKLQREDSRTVPIIAMTANAFEEDIKKSRASGMDAHLAKPIEPGLLFETLSRFLD